MKILILASNPRKDLNLDREIRDLKRAIENSRNQEEFEVVDELAVRVGDLQELLHKHRPQIVHFCGHGSGKQGLVFESDMGREHWVSTDALSNLFRLFSSRVECVLLNACYSEEQAGAIVDHINYVIGMNQEIRDDAAIAFSKGFYRALGYACSIEQSYEFGCNAIQLEISGSSVVRSAVSETERKFEVTDAVAKIAIPEHQKPILKKKQTLTPSSSAGIPSPNQIVSQEKRTEIQLDIDASLKADSKVMQYRDRVREFLGDRKLTEFEKIRLDQLQKSLGLSDGEAMQILAEEQEPIRKAQEEYEEMLIRLIEEGHYPFNAEISDELQALRQELELTDSQVETISKPILEAIEEDYQEKLRQQTQQEQNCRSKIFSGVYPVPHPEILNPISEEKLHIALNSSLSKWKKLVSPLPEDKTNVRVEIYRQYKFKTFIDAIEFMNKVAPNCEKFALHHPRWENIWRTVNVYLTTWDIGHQISDRDIRLAKSFEQAFSTFYGADISEVNLVPPSDIIPDPLSEDMLHIALNRNLSKWKKIVSPLPENTAQFRVEIYRQYQFKTFIDAIKFMKKIAPGCEFIGHYPRWENIWRTVNVYLTTWDIGYQLSDRDIQLAKCLEQAFPTFSGADTFYPLR